MAGDAFFARLVDAMGGGDLMSSYGTLAQRVADPDRLPEMKVGFVAPAQRLAAHVGIGRAKELIYNGRLLPAAEALELGLVTTVTDDLPGEVERASARYASSSAYAFPFAKQAIQRCYGPGRSYDAEEQAAAFATFRGPDFAEGAAAALEGRRPRFTAQRPAATDELRQDIR